MDASSDHAGIEFPVQKQLEAYNARDIDAFMLWWAEDCEYYEFPTRLLARGTAEIRERHIARFQEPNLHGRLIKRIAAANVVVDQETVTRTFSDGPGEVDVVAIYEVADARMREHDVEVADRQQVGLARGQPLSRRRTLTLRTVAVAAGNGKFPLAALWANSVMGSWQAVRGRFRLFSDAVAPGSRCSCPHNSGPLGATVGLANRSQAPGGDDVGEVFCDTENDCSPPCEPKRTIYRWVRRVARARRLRRVRCGALSARGGPHRALHAGTG